MISIIIPSYNHQNFIKKTLDYVLEDEFKDKELVIIDDGSTDNSPKIISDWVEQNKDNLSITYKHRPNKGLNATINELISLSKGEYIVMMGSDDYLLKGGLQKRYDYLTKHPDKKAVFADAVLIDKDDNILYESMLFEFRGYPRDAFKDSKSIKDTLLKRFVLAGPILMVKKELYDEIGLYDENLLAEDLDFYLRVIPKNLVGFIPEKVSAYRVHDTNQSIGNIKPKLLKDSRISFLKHMHLYELKDKPKMLWNALKFFIREKLLEIKLLLKS